MALRLSALHAGCPLPPRKIPGTISVRGWVDPRATVRLEGLSKLKINPPHRDLNPRPCFNQLRYRVPPAALCKISKFYFNSTIKMNWSQVCARYQHCTESHHLVDKTSPVAGWTIWSVCTTCVLTTGLQLSVVSRWGASSTESEGPLFSFRSQWQNPFSLQIASWKFFRRLAFHMSHSPLSDAHACIVTKLPSLSLQLFALSILKLGGTR
jgi:hypothetical protein